MRNAQETAELLKAFSDQILTMAEEKGLTRYEVSNLPNMLEIAIKREWYTKEELYKRNPQR